MTDIFELPFTATDGTSRTTNPRLDALPCDYRALYILPTQAFPVPPPCLQHMYNTRTYAHSTTTSNTTEPNGEEYAPILESAPSGRSRSNNKRKLADAPRSLLQLCDDKKLPVWLHGDDAKIREDRAKAAAVVRGMSKFLKDKVTAAGRSLLSSSVDGAQFVERKLMCIARALHTPRRTPPLPAARPPMSSPLHACRMFRAHGRRIHGADTALPVFAPSVTVAESLAPTPL